MSGNMPLMPETILCTTLVERIFILIKSKLVELVVCDFDKSVEKRSYFKIRRIMVDWFYLWSIPFVLIYLNKKEIVKNYEFNPDLLLSGLKLI